MNDQFTIKKEAKLRKRLSKMAKDSLPAMIIHNKQLKINKKQIIKIFRM